MPSTSLGWRLTRGSVYRRWWMKDEAPNRRGNEHACCSKQTRGTALRVRPTCGLPSSRKWDYRRSIACGSGSWKDSKRGSNVGHHHNGSIVSWTERGKRSWSRQAAASRLKDAVGGRCNFWRANRWKLRWWRVSATNPCAPCSKKPASTASQAAMGNSTGPERRIRGGDGRRAGSLPAAKGSAATLGLPG